MLSNQALGVLSLISGEALSGRLRNPPVRFNAVTASMNTAASRR